MLLEGSKLRYVDDSSVVGGFFSVSVLVLEKAPELEHS